MGTRNMLLRSVVLVVLFTLSGSLVRAEPRSPVPNARAVVAGADEVLPVVARYTMAIGDADGDPPSGPSIDLESGPVRGYVSSGCLSNAACSTGYYCSKETGDCTGVGTCERFPAMCAAYVDPVCGCDGRTYSNDCYAAAAGVNVEHAGACASTATPTSSPGATLTATPTATPLATATNTPQAGQTPTAMVIHLHLPLIRVGA